MTPREILGVSDNAGKDEIKSAFRRLAMLHHPDRNGGDALSHQKFVEINAAYRELERIGFASGNSWNGSGQHGGHWQQDENRHQGHADPFARFGRKRKAKRGVHNKAYYVRVPTDIMINGGGIDVSIRHGGEKCRLHVTLPAHVVNFTKFSISMENGEKFPISIVVEAKPNCKQAYIDDGDVLIDRKISPEKLEKGTTTTIIAPDGRKLRLKISPGTTVGTVFRIPDRGLYIDEVNIGMLFIRLV